ncbi:MAG: hypothetical protein M9883_17620 [Methylobacteriaceae bacterium]|nr:hypothetical protein [Methylobacteriaceae bacterium]
MTATTTWVQSIFEGLSTTQFSIEEKVWRGLIDVGPNQGLCQRTWYSSYAVLLVDCFHWVKAMSFITITMSGIFTTGGTRTKNHYSRASDSTLNQGVAANSLV